MTMNMHNVVHIIFYKINPFNADPCNSAKGVHFISILPHTRQLLAQLSCIQFLLR